MSVIKNLRGLSDMEFYKNAIDIRRTLTLWLLKDFGLKRNERSVNQVIKNIREDDQKTIDEIFSKYGKTSNHEYKSEYPDWFVNVERDYILAILRDIVKYITLANSVFAHYDFEFDLRRKYQNEAISTCYLLLQELQYITVCFPTNVNSFIPTIEKVEREVQLLKGWRQSDNKQRKGKSC